MPDMCENNFYLVGSKIFTTDPICYLHFIGEETKVLRSDHTAGKKMARLWSTILPQHPWPAMTNLAKNREERIFQILRSCFCV
jgi:hypothetical protein